MQLLSLSPLEVIPSANSWDITLNELLHKEHIVSVSILRDADVSDLLPSADTTYSGS